MTNDTMRLLGGAAGVALIAAVGGYGIGQWSGESATPPGAGIPKKGKPAEVPTDSVAMAENAIRQAGIAVETIKEGGLGVEIMAQATVSHPPSGEAIVTARAGGAVTRVFKRLGDPVRAGEALAIVESRDAAQIAADRSVANARVVQAQKALAREQYLYKERVSAKVELEQAQAAAATAMAEARRAQVAAGAANVTRDGRGVIVASPISGKIAAEAVTLGAFVQPETELYRVADPSRIQIEAAIAPADARRVSPGDRAIVELPDGRTVDASVRAVTPTLSGATRSATAVLNVPAGLQPGLAVRVRLMPAPGNVSKAIVVPEDAVQSLEGRDVVFVRTPQGFRAVTVRLGQRSAGRVEILSGLQASQSVATRNAFLLKAELGKGAGEEE
ncbi:efflux RND transporter periplasmic adaptor subunit [Sphingomonas sp. QA11]|uniref:efflux RND transporter periplasmic adaptor subunit n=1 Tax=Sphingomonas sp. QA11 TaxID=2950605 RepID=UPI00234AFE10|nr:efflux RND transporter periplasmic adaptor subunit [Sphingomonas sp. QA11]WCM26111.1 efflux RND transporter periplasmic adaptor subunit [Sphingomonas sp. QA11]